MLYIKATITQQKEDKMRQDNAENSSGKVSTELKFFEFCRESLERAHMAAPLVEPSAVTITKNGNGHQKARTL